MTKKVPNIHELMMVQVIRTADFFSHRIGKLMKENGLTMPQYNILRILRGAEGAISLGEVKSRMHFDTSDVSRLVDRLVKKELVGRDICQENRRKLDVCISKEGLKLLGEIDIKLSERLDGFYKDVIPSGTAIDITKQLEKITSLESSSNNE